MIKYPIILASKSPRRQELLQQMGFDFKVVLKEVDESFPSHLSPKEIAEYISANKAKAFDEEINNAIVITADTIVAIDGLILGKPENFEEAVGMLKRLSGKRHEVITGVSILHQHHINTFSDSTYVYFDSLTDEQITYYLNKYQPYDKAGSYGVQEWIGWVGVNRIEGSYSNIMGLPTHKLYQQLLRI